ncbi:ankyrin repeat-containing domain protein [Mariannaea sp. PMI_226]|nr:ankyrin repeat-containing domain protein [Mariannaea sp. PMI_226]
MGSLDDVDPNHDRTALHYAVMKNSPGACRFLLQAGADPFVEDKSGMSATQKAWEHIFSKRGPQTMLDEFKVLFSNNDLDYWNISPLRKAVIGLEGFKLPETLCLDADSMEVDARDARQQTALHWAAQRRDLRAIESLLNVGADVDVVDEHGCTPLLFAASATVPRIVELSILSGADVNTTNNRGDSPLHYAARHKDDLDSVKILVRAGAQLDCRNKLGNTPFAGAAIMNRVAAGKYLLNCGAKKYNKNKYGDTPLRETIHHNQHAFLQMLLDDDTNINEVKADGSSLLHSLALEGDTKTVQILAAAGIVELDTQLKNARGKTAMDICQERIKAPEGFKDAFAKLLALGF